MVEFAPHRWLALSVSERTRELGVLRAVGMRRGQLAATVTMRPVSPRVFGALLGIALGATLAAALVAAGTLVVPVGQLVAYLVVAVLAVGVPARRPPGWTS
jgi:putative ABC transport system permease protein